MVQTTGETRDAIMEETNRDVERIVRENSWRDEPYWIVLFAKPLKGRVNGKPTLVQHIKAYANRPTSQVGMVIGKVNNKTGTIEWEVNMPQKPFAWEKLGVIGGKSKEEVVVETTTIGHAYVTQ